MIGLQRLEGFYWVARVEGYARAARAFPYPITQPGVHQQVKRLEDELGVRLFERIGKDRVALTAAGRRLYAFVAPFLERLPVIARSLQSGELGGTLRIHAAGHVLRQLMPAWLRRLQARRPDIQVQLSEVRTADLSALRAGEADLLVDHLPELPVDVEAAEVGRMRAFLVLPLRHPLARRKHLKLSELQGEPFVSYHSEPHRELQLRGLALHGASPTHTHSADSSETILAFVSAGLGFSVVPSLLAGGPRVEGVAAQRLTRPTAEFPVHAVWRKMTVKDPLVEAALALAPRPSPATV